ncbi:MAG: glutamine-hydrolyzing GMP synthase [bacterium]|nr:glutamine-hydrolyzing GMP synthase [bacterium]
MAPAPSVPKNAFQTILIVDLGAQYTQLIARRIRELNVYSEVVDNKVTAKQLKNRPEVIGIILSGGPNSAHKFKSPKIDPELLDGRIPVLGICYGLQLMGTLIGCKVETARRQEFGRTELWVDNQEDSLLFRGLNPFLVAWMSHGDCVAASPALPRGARITAHTDATPVAAFEWQARKLYAVQFHPEVTHTPWGIELLRNFVVGACNARGDWTMGNFVDIATDLIRGTVDNTPPGGLLVATADGISSAGLQTRDGGPEGSPHYRSGATSQPLSEVICAVSGGVDSLCTAALVDRAIGERLHPIFVDHGFLRAEEGNKVVQAWRGHFKSKLIRVNAGPRFLGKLKGVSDPERKRKIIGREFIDVFDEHAKQFRSVKFLAQGTLYPDVIESKGVGLHGKVIKTHHNVGGLPKKMKLGLIEPLRDLFKDEVRKLGVELGLPRPLVYRQPFPGPGLAIRIIGEVTAERLRLLRAADKIVRDEIELAEMDRPWQYFAVLPAVKTVGVMGDNRTYGYPLVVRAVSSEDAMTADWSKIPFRNLERISSRIIGEVKGINRVCLDITSKPPATIEWE